MCWLVLLCTGAGGAAHQIYELLDVKHMQLDSLGYYHCNHVFVTGQFAVTSALYEATLKFFTGNYKDVSWNMVVVVLIILWGSCFFVCQGYW